MKKYKIALFVISEVKQLTNFARPVYGCRFIRVLAGLNYYRNLPIKDAPNKGPVLQIRENHCMSHKSEDGSSNSMSSRTWDSVTTPSLHSEGQDPSLWKLK